jgi:uncharacterized protein (TIGR02118 family)
MAKLILVHAATPGGEWARDAYLESYAPAIRATGLARHCVLNVVRDQGEDVGQAPGIDWPDAPTFNAVTELEVRDADDARALVAGLPPSSGEVLAYLVDHHLQKGADPGPRQGRSPGVKNMFLVRRADGMTEEAFRAHWLDRHVPLALKHHVGMSRYVTDVVTQALSDGAPDVDGLAQLQFATEEDFEHGMFDDPPGERIIAEDVTRFLSAAVGTRVDEHPAW